MMNTINNPDRFNRALSVSIDEGVNTFSNFCKGIEKGLNKSSNDIITLATRYNDLVIEYYKKLKANPFGVIKLTSSDNHTEIFPIKYISLVPNSFRYIFKVPSDGKYSYSEISIMLPDIEVGIELNRMTKGASITKNSILFGSIDSDKNDDVIRLFQYICGDKTQELFYLRSEDVSKVDIEAYDSLDTLLLKLEIKE